VRLIFPTAADRSAWVLLASRFPDPGSCWRVAESLALCRGGGPVPVSADVPAAGRAKPLPPLAWDFYIVQCGSHPAHVPFWRRGGSFHAIMLISGPFVMIQCDLRCLGKSLELPYFFLLGWTPVAVVGCSWHPHC
jgi:hypothetical protein